MAEKKIDPMEALKSEDCKLRNAAMVYLHEDRHVDFDFLSEITGLKLSTVVNYVRSKFCHLIEWAREIFLKGKYVSRMRYDEIIRGRCDRQTNLGRRCKNQKELSGKYKNIFCEVPV